MKCSDSQTYQSTIFSALQTKISSTQAWRTGLTALLVVASGIVPEDAIASSLQPNETLFAQTPTPQDPETGSDSAGSGTSEATPFKTITAALNQAQPGTVIQLAPGNYTSETGEVFPLAIKPGVTLRGDESTKGQNVVINGGGNYVSPTFARQSVAVLAGKDSTISGVTVTNTNTRGTGLWIESTNPTVTNNTLTNNNRDGVFVTGTAFGLAIGCTSSPLVTDNQIRQNKVGIYVSESARPILRNNVIEKNDQDGIVATINAQPDLGTAESAGQNTIRGNKRYDVYNATRGNTLLAVGNDIDPKKISGKVDFVAAQIALRDIKGLWAQPYIEALANQKIIAGFPDGTFRPNEPVTRAQFATIVSKAFSPQPQRPAVNFKDVSPKFWANEAIQTAYRGGFVAGYPGGLFQPQQPIPRVQALVSLVSGLKLSAKNPNVISVYADAAQIPDYATGAVAAATEQQLVVNYPTPKQLNPNREATRAEIAAFVYQALVNAGRAKPIASPYVVRLP